jgi:hypothetical protein
MSMLKTFCLSTLVCLVISTLVGCGSGIGPSGPVPTTVAVSSVAAASPTVLLGNTVQFSATVTGTSNTTVTWSVGGSGTGSINAAGLYTAPGDLPSPTTVNITATSQADSSKSSTASITVASDVVLTLATAPPSVPTSGTLQFAAVISSSGHPDPTVVWGINAVAGGNGTVGTVSATGVYTAPPNVPSPFTVTVSATSAADPTKSATAAVVIAGTISTVTQAITAALGGTVTLPDGSSVIIPAGALTSDQTVTLSEVSALPRQPLNSLITGVGPGLVLSFAVPNAASLTLSRNSIFPQVASPQNSSIPPDLQFSVVVGQNTVTGLQGSAPIADLVDAAAAHNFIGAQGAFHSFTNVAQIAVSSSFLSSVSSLAVSMANWSVGATPQNGARILNGSTWSQFSSCPAPSANGKVLVLVHGMSSSVEQAFDGPCAADIQSQGNYGQAFGFDYDWTQDINQSGAQLADFLNTIAQCPGVTQVDIEAHSEGVPVSLSAATQASQAQSKIMNFVSLGGPIMGTPAASFPQALVTALLNLPGVFVPPGSSLQNTPGAPFLTGLVPGSAEMATIRQNFATLLPKTKVIVVGGDLPNWPPLVLKPLSVLFPNEPYDDLIGLSSALPQNSGLPNVTPLPAYGVGHTALECDPAVKKDVGQAVQNLTTLQVSPTQLTFIASQGGPNPSNQALSISCSGAAASWSATESVPWLSLSPTSGTGSASTAVSVDVTGLTSGTYGGTVSVTTNGATVVVQVTLVVTGSTTFSGSLSGTNIDQGAGGCSGSASMSGTATMTLTPVTDGSFSVTGQWTMNQSAGICDDYSGTYSLTGTVDTSGNVMFSTALANGTGTLTGTGISGAWGFTSGPGPDVASGTFLLTAQ